MPHRQPADSLRRLVLPLLTVALAAVAWPMSAAEILIDDFAAPGPGATIYVIDLLNPNPTIIETTDPGILGGERDLIVQVLGTSGPVGANGAIGAGSYIFGSAAARSAIATLLYDGVEAGAAGPSSMIEDLTGGGTNGAFRLEFQSLQGGAASAIDVRIDIASAGGTATVTQSIAENGSPFNVLIPFSSFSTTGSFSFAAVNSLQFTFNSGAVADTDFVLNAVYSAVPEPATLALGLFGSLGLGFAAWRIRR